MMLMYLLLTIFLSVAFFTLFERKILSIIQMRYGPNKLGFNGIFQPFGDAMKLFSKNTDNLIKSNMIFFLMPIFFIFLSMMFFFFKLLIFGFFFNYSLIFIMFLYSLSVYNPLITGWISNSKYSLIGSIRSIIQSISYEITMGLIFFYFGLIFSTISLFKIIILNFNFLNLFFSYIIFFMLLINFLIENNRIPFDLSESESELISGFNVEYGGMEFSFIFLGENLMLIFNSYLISLLLFNMNLNSLICLFLISLFIIIRGSYPRFRFDYLLNLCWLILIPLIIIYLMLIWLFI